MTSEAPALAMAKAQVEQAKAGELSAAANVEQMNAKLVQAAAEWKRAQALYSSKLMAEVDYDTDEANYEVAKSDVSVAEAGVAEAKAATVQAQASLDGAQLTSAEDNAHTHGMIALGTEWDRIQFDNLRVTQ